jgi:hypothetical protein
MSKEFEPIVPPEVAFGRGKLSDGKYVYGKIDLAWKYQDGEKVFGKILTASDDSYYFFKPNEVDVCFGISDREGNYIYENDIVELENRQRLIMSEVDGCRYSNYTFGDLKKGLVIGNVRDNSYLVGELHF